MCVILILAVFATARALPQATTESTGLTETTKINETIETIETTEIKKATGITETTEIQETTEAYVYKPPRIGGCRLPPNPPHAVYKPIKPPRVEPGQVFDTMTLDIICDRGYGIVKGRRRASCVYGSWGLNYAMFPEGKCEPFCEIPKDETMEYRCPVKVYGSKCHMFFETGLIKEVPCPIQEGADKGYRPCKEFEPNATLVQPVYKDGGAKLPKMICSEGRWEADSGLASATALPQAPSESTGITETTKINETIETTEPTQINKATRITETTETQETTEAYVYKPPRIGGCRLPPNPPHAVYKPIEPPLVEPGQVFDTMTLDIICDRGYGIVKGSKRAVCIYGLWGLNPKVFPQGKCEQFCTTPKNDTVEYQCPVDPVPPKCYRYRVGGRFDVVPCPIPEGADKGFRICKEFEKTGTVVKSVLKSSSEELPMMTCSSGSWEVEPSNMTELTTPVGVTEPILK